DCRPFAADSDGTMLGEGIGMVALKRLDDAERDGDAIYAVIRGIGTSSDGRAKSIYAPLAAGQALALRRAYARAGYGADTVALEEYEGDAPRPDRLRTTASELVLISAPDSAALAEACRHEAERSDVAGALPHIARRTQLAFDPAAPARVAIVASDEADLKDK